GILGLSTAACQEIYLAGILHDIGKIGVPDSILKKDGPLSEAEFRVICQHPEIGYHTVEPLGHLQFALPGILYHHERWDGAGYPHGLRGQSIPLMARILAVADAFDALTSSRPYRQGVPRERARQIILGGAGEQWDAEVVECLQLWLDQRRDPGHGLSTTLHSHLRTPGAAPSGIDQAVQQLTAADTLSAGNGGQL
ncbi:MAG: HD-GYP domain-containing protein, partial [Planctomycetales bacterium]|nr:HD-GYP domain-containing protein [Planctomycetales bacterium]